MNKKIPFSLSNKVALITGGASGLGFAIAKCYHQCGAKVIITGTRDKEKLDEACKEIGDNSYSYQVDVSDTKNAKKFIEKIEKEHGSVDILVNNAGVHCKKPFEDIKMDEFEKVISVHLKGSFALTQAVTPSMKKKKSGSIIFISSMSAYLGMTQVSAYSSVKSAILGLTKALSGELSEYGIRVNCITPGFIDTPMFHKAVDSDIERQKKILNHTPMKKYGKPEDIGWAAVFLASEEASFINAVSLPVDGGCIIGF